MFRLRTRRTRKASPLCQTWILVVCLLGKFRCFRCFNITNATIVPVNAVTTFSPSAVPSELPSGTPSSVPSKTPSVSPSQVPSGVPTRAPSTSPSSWPSKAPSKAPTQNPSLQPSLSPSVEPSSQPSVKPSTSPTVEPTGSPSFPPSLVPSLVPSVLPSNVPSAAPIVVASVAGLVAGGYNEESSEGGNLQGDTPPRSFDPVLLGSLLGIVGIAGLGAAIMHMRRGSKKERIHTTIFMRQPESEQEAPFEEDAEGSLPVAKRLSFPSNQGGDEGGAASKNKGLDNSKSLENNEDEFNGEDIKLETSVDFISGKEDEPSHVDLYLEKTNSLVSEMYDSPSQIADQIYFQQLQNQATNAVCFPGPLFCMANEQDDAAAMRGLSQRVNLQTVYEV